MKTSYIIYIVLLSLLYCGCNFDQKQNIFIGENQYIKTFNDTITLNGKKIDIENMGANTIDVVDSFLVFSCSQLDTFYNVSMNRFGRKINVDYDVELYKSFI